MMRRILFLTLIMLGISTAVQGASMVETFEIEGLISPASPKALTEGLEEKLSVKVVGLDLKNTKTGWPVLSVEFDSEQVSKDQIGQAIASIEDPAGHNYRLHDGPPAVNAAYTDEEMKAMTALGPAAPDIPAVTNPMDSSAESIDRGKQTFDTYCTTCHGSDGGGHGPAAHGITTFPRQLWVWNNSDATADGYLYWFITNGRNEMPPWGVILSENERWDVINYIKTIEKPE